MNEKKKNRVIESFRNFHIFFPHDSNLQAIKFRLKRNSSRIVKMNIRVEATNWKKKKNVELTRKIIRSSLLTLVDGQ